MKDKFKELQEDVLAEQKLIEKTVQRLSTIKSQLPLAEDDHKTEPAMGTYLMNFYNGVENIVKRICKVYYEMFPAGKIGIKNYWTYPTGRRKVNFLFFLKRLSVGYINIRTFGIDL